MSYAFWQSRSVLVTGASGFLGGWLIPALCRRGAKVVAQVREGARAGMFLQDGWMDRVPVIWGSLSDCGTLSRFIEEHEVDTIFHLAAQTQVGLAKLDPIATLEANARGSWNLLEAARATRGCQVLVASSEMVYGEPLQLPHREEDPLRGEYPYDVSKICVDLISRMYAVTYGLPVGIVRCANLFGGGDCNLARSIPGMIQATLRGEPFQIRSDGQYVRDFLYAEDAVAAYLVLAEKLAERPALSGEAFNFSLEEPTTVLALVQRVLRLMGRPDLEPVVLGNASAEIREQHLCSKKARRLLGWQPRVGMDEGLRRTIDWYSEAASQAVAVEQVARAGAKC